MYQNIDGVRVWGTPEESAVRQAVQCSWVGDVATVALMADHHKGYSQPIGGMVAYRGFVSPSGVGYDIGCGNKAVRAPIKAADIRADLPRIVDDIARQVSFGLGRKNGKAVDHALFDDPAWTDSPQVGALKDLARKQLGTVGGGNHFVDLSEDPPPALYSTVHGAGRIMSRSAALGKRNPETGRREGGLVSPAAMVDAVHTFGVELRGGDVRDPYKD